VDIKQLLELNHMVKLTVVLSKQQLLVNEIIQHVINTGLPQQTFAAPKISHIQ